MSVEAAFENLSIMAVVSSTLSVLFGTLDLYVLDLTAG